MRVLLAALVLLTSAEPMPNGLQHVENATNKTKKPRGPPKDHPVKPLDHPRLGHPVEKRPKPLTGKEQSDEAKKKATPAGGGDTGVKKKQPPQGEVKKKPSQGDDDAVKKNQGDDKKKPSQGDDKKKPSQGEDAEKKKKPQPKKKKKKEDPKVTKMKRKLKRKLNDELDAAKSHLLLCQWFPICEVQSKRLMLSVASIGKLTKKPRINFYSWMMAWCMSLVIAMNWRKWINAEQAMTQTELKAETRTMTGCYGAMKTYAAKWCSSEVWGFGEISFAASSLRLFIGMIVLLECSGFTTPELDIFAAPEIVRLATYPSFPPQTGDIVHEPDVVQTLMPDLKPETRTHYVHKLQRIRFLCVLAWCIFVLIPAPTSSSTTTPTTTTPRTSFLGHPVVLRWGALVSYTVGAVCYVTLGAIGLMYDHCHSPQGPMLLVLSLSVVVYDVSDDPKDPRGRRAAKWLRTFLFVSVLAPIYLCSGISKLRYEGIYDNFVKADWLKRALLSDLQRQTYPKINNYIGTSQILATFFSWGNQVFETFLPLLVLFNPMGPRYQGVMNYLLLLVAACFHIYVFFFLGPNFSRLGLMLLLATDPLGVVLRFRRKCLVGTTTTTTNKKKPVGFPEEDDMEVEAYDDTEETKDDRRSLLPKVTLLRHGDDEKKASAVLLTPSTADFCRGIFGFVVLLAFFRVQLASDFDHWTKRIPPNQHHNPYFPIPEFAMFTRATKQINSYTTIAIFDLLLVSALVVKYGPLCSCRHTHQRRHHSYLQWYASH